jgi:hypothetical protein
MPVKLLNRSENLLAFAQHGHVNMASKSTASPSSRKLAAEIEESQPHLAEHRRSAGSQNGLLCLAWNMKERYADEDRLLLREVLRHAKYDLVFLQEPRWVQNTFLTNLSGNLNEDDPDGYWAAFGRKYVYTGGLEIDYSGTGKTKAGFLYNRKTLELVRTGIELADYCSGKSKTKWRKRQDWRENKTLTEYYGPKMVACQFKEKTGEQRNFLAVSYHGSGRTINPERDDKENPSKTRRSLFFETTQEAQRHKDQLVGKTPTPVIISADYNVDLAPNKH